MATISKEAWTAVIALGILIFILVVVIWLLGRKSRRVHYVGAIHVVVDSYDSDHYMFLVIEKGKEQYIQDGNIVKLKIVEDIPERGRDET